MVESKNHTSEKKLNNEKRKKGNAYMAFRRFMRNPLAVMGSILLIIVLILAVIAPFIVPYNYAEMDVTNRFLGPCAEHIFGTDQLGRDVLSRVLIGARYSLIIGLATTLVSNVLGIVLGLICGYFGKTVDLVIMRILDVVSSIPGMLLAVCISAVLGNGFWQIIVALGIAGIPGCARMMRASVMTVRDQEYVEASTAINNPKAWTLFRHVFPNASSPMIVSATMSIGTTITMAAGMSFVGLGVQPPTPEWGAMLSDAQNYMRDYPYLIVAPGICIMLVVLSVNLMGDALRDVLDPKLRK